MDGWIIYFKLIDENTFFRMDGWIWIHEHASRLCKYSVYQLHTNAICTKEQQ